MIEEEAGTLVPTTKCYECGKEVKVNDAILIKFGFSEIFGLMEELDEGIGEYLEEFGDFHVCKECDSRILKAVVGALEDLQRVL